MTVEQLPGMSLDALLTNKVVETLRTSAPAEEALRLALLHCIVLLRDHDDPAAKNYCTFLLESFAPLAGHFVGEQHAYATGISVSRLSAKEGHVVLGVDPDAVARLILPGMDAPAD